MYEPNLRDLMRAIRKMPSKLSQVANKDVPELARNEAQLVIKTYTETDLPKTVTGFLTDNAQMQKVLNDHSFHLNQQLITLTAEITEDPEHHAASQLLLDSMKQKWEEQLKQAEIQHQEQLARQTQAAQVKLDEVTAARLQEIEDLKRSFDDFKSVTVSSLRSNYGMGFMGYVVLTGLVSYCMTKTS